MLIVPVRVKKTSKHVGQGHFFITLNNCTTYLRQKTRLRFNPILKFHE